GEIKLVAMLKDELRKNKVEAKEAGLALSGQDLIIRTFEMPAMPRDELDTAVRFEAKKYIPFKIEDLIADFQVQQDKSSKKNLILFVAVKKEVMDKYLSILSQLGLKVSSLEYSAFSLLRLIKASNANDKGLSALMAVDFKSEDEANFIVSESGFPLFSRDISLGEAAVQPQGAQGQDSGLAIERLKTEIRISLDYYHRKFPAKKIEKMFFVAAQDFRAEIEVFIKDLGLSIQYLDSSKFIKDQALFSLNTAKAYSVSLAKAVKGEVRIDLLAAPAKAKERVAQAKAVSFSLSGLLKEYQKIILAGFLICAATFGFGIYRTMPVKKELSSVIASRPQVPGINSELAYEELSNINEQYKRKADSLDKLIKNQAFLAKLLESIASLKPEGLWLKKFDFRKEANSLQLVLNGMAFLDDSDMEFQAVNIFLANLKESPSLKKYFPEMAISSLDKANYKEKNVTTFIISCRASRRD
ncbi:MAG TPA: pilus assembly protein PilM, partial [Candidatus Omnitrophota bacterium]|nr:pilus assembly protein PilM [Candidatus Omnitrophota bacterium]